MGSRGKRRLGTIEKNKENRFAWVGFAGLQQTVVEKLVREGGRRDEDEISSTLPLSRNLADLRHMLGGECDRQDVQDGVKILLDNNNRNREKNYRSRWSDK